MSSLPEIVPVVMMTIPTLKQMGYLLTFRVIDKEIVFHPGHEFIYKFLVFDDGTLVISPLIEHVDVLALFRHETSDEGEKSGLIGAGAVGQDGLVNSWHSERLHVQTPREWEEPIQLALLGLFDDGTLPLPSESA